MTHSDQSDDCDSKEPTDMEGQRGLAALQIKYVRETQRALLRAQKRDGM